MILTGRIFDIVVVNDKYAQIVLRKKLGDKVVPVAIGVFGYYKDKIINVMKLRPKDKIKGNIYMKSKIWNGKYYTDVYFKEVYLVEEGARPMGSGGMFEPPSEIEEIDELNVDTSTGEVFDDE